LKTEKRKAARKISSELLFYLKINGGAAETRNRRFRARRFKALMKINNRCSMNLTMW
jgi:hypothetical protein